MSHKVKKESIWIKVYIIALFFCGVGMWFSAQSAHKHKVCTATMLDRRIMKVLIANGVIKNDIISQHIKERDIKTAVWNEFYKVIKLKSGETVKSFEKIFRSIASSMKMGLSRTDNDDGSVTYKFYLPGKNYSNITFVNSKEPSRG